VYPIATMCRVLEVSTSGYYAWRTRAPSARAKSDAALGQQIVELHERSRRIYGAPKLHADLKDLDIRVGRKRVARLMSLHGIVGVSRRKGCRTTRRDRDARPAPDLVERNFTARAADQLWVADITYVPTKEGWLYLAVVLDLYSRRVVGWAMKSTMQDELVREALRAAILKRRPESGLLCHSDRGTQYASEEYQKQLKSGGLICSMSRKGNCYDNAAVESFFASLKRELVHRTTFQTHRQARAAMFEWIEVWYNRQRRHSTLGYLSPEAFEEKEREETLRQRDNHTEMVRAA